MGGKKLTVSTFSANRVAASRDRREKGMASGDEGNSSALGDLSRNWRSALVVNGLFDALEETERQRDELAQNLR